MEGNDFVWLASIVVGMTLVGWLVLDWLESAQQWEAYDLDGGLEHGANAMTAANGNRSHEAIDVEMELLLCYPLDPFAPTLLWRPLPQDEWIEAQEQEPQSIASAPSPSYSAG